MQPAVYILASHPDGTPHTGVTAKLRERVWEHRTGVEGGFTKRYGVKCLVYYELHPDMPSAIRREKNIKAWPRAWKVALIEAQNPDWRDLYDDLCR